MQTVNMFVSRSQMMRLLVCTLIVFTALLPHLGNAQTDERCFAETSYCISGRIRAFWETQGGLPVFGYPITPQRTEYIEGQPFQVQWFERNRLELHPENSPPYDVLSGRLGALEVEKAREDGVNLSDREEPREGCVFFDTGWNVCDEFLQAYRANGLEQDGVAGFSLNENIALFGLPLSPVITATRDGVTVDVQLFERARFEHHPDNQPPYNVQFGLLGRENLAQQTLPVLSETPTPESPGKSFGSPHPTESSICAEVADPVNAVVRPSKCVTAGDVLSIDIFGFDANEQVGFWITAPDDSVFGTKETVTIGDTGDARNLPIDTSDLPSGNWSIVFRGVSSGHTSIVYFRVR